ncbi:hypothetical protein KSP39_PZI001557 [Platanthera zijinensis]|uniref:Uncharacterized protein n=1 Tax=Platanthera zijinensis TaxID=2320716 RepID=A0AAP0GGB6_9ASPA
MRVKTELIGAVSSLLRVQTEQMPPETVCLPAVRRRCSKLRRQNTKPKEALLIREFGGSKTVMRTTAGDCWCYHADLEVIKYVVSLPTQYEYMGSHMSTLEKLERVSKDSFEDSLNKRSQKLRTSEGLFGAALATGEFLFQPPELFFNFLGQLLVKSFSEIWSCSAALQKSPPPPSFSFRKIAFSLTGFGNVMVSSVGTLSEAGRPSSGDSEPRTAFLRRFRAPDGLSPAIPSALLHRTLKHSAAFQNCSLGIYFKTALSEQQLFNPPELSQTEPENLIMRFNHLGLDADPTISGRVSNIPTWKNPIRQAYWKACVYASAQKIICSSDHTRKSCYLPVLALLRMQKTEKDVRNMGRQVEIVEGAVVEMRHDMGEMQHNMDKKTRSANSSCVDLKN